LAHVTLTGQPSRLEDAEKESAAENTPFCSSASIRHDKMGSSETSLPYHEPDITTILILASFLLLSNAVNRALDRLVYCGLIGQILIGVAWGTPGGKWLNESIETAVVQFGYLGLILLVYEGNLLCATAPSLCAHIYTTGGLSTSFKSLKANILLSITVAITGIAAPIGLTFTLGGIANATPLQCFAAGAALCSTSLGTTFTILGTTGLLKTRLGVVLTSAAILDDIVGLVMVQVISNLGSSASHFSATTVVRPVCVSVAFAVMCPLLCCLVIKPVTLKLTELREKNRDGLLHRTLCRVEVAFGLHTAILVGMVTSSTCAGTSNLFAAYLAGAMISWWDTEIPHFTPSPQESQQEHEKSNSGILKDGSAPVTDKLEHAQSGAAIYEKYYMSANEKILKPFFFVSGLRFSL
jgi:hypothetical protein